MRLLNKVLLVLILLLPVVLAQDVENYNNYGSLEIDFRQEASIIAESNSQFANFKIDDLNAYLSFFPRDSFNQIVLEQTPYAEPGAEITEEDVIHFYWRNPRERKIKFYVDSKVKTINKLQKIKNKIEYPNDEIGDNEKYLEATDIIDINENITKKASEIIEGQTDYYRVVFKLGDWIQKNVDYSLNSLTEEPVQSANWVLNNRQGVCDEITTLYIAFLRSMGIPARFVSGQAYSNIDYKFGNHGWAEVYFPEIGWVPADVTFKQIGWIDPSHVKCQIETDPTESAINYEWKARDTELTFNPLYIKTDVSKTLGEKDVHATLEVESLKSKAGPGSFIPIKITIKNLEEYYLPSIISIKTAPNLTEDNRKVVLLDPKEKQVVFWIAKMPENFEEGAYYETTIRAVSSFSESNSTSILLSDTYNVYDKEWAEKKVERLAPKDEKNYFPEIDFECKLDKEYYYREEIGHLGCTVENKGNTNFPYVKICHETTCYDKELLIGDKKAVEWELEMQELEGPEVLVTAESQNLIKHNYLKLKIIEEPEIVVHDFEPKEIGYDEESELSFRMSSNVTANNVTLNIPGYGHSFIKAVREEKALAFPVEGKDFKRGKAELEIIYYDEAGKRYISTYNFNLKVENLPWHQRLLLWVEKLLS